MMTSASNVAAAVPTGATPTNPDPRALADVLSELQSLGAIDPVTQSKLIEDMKDRPGAVAADGSGLPRNGRLSAAAGRTATGIKS